MIFNRVVVGVDGSQAGYSACRLAARLCAPGGQLTALAVAETPYALYAGLAAPEWDWRVRAEAQQAREAVLAEFAGDARVEAHVAVGRAARELLAGVTRLDADLIALGSHGRSRTAGIVLGSAATRIVHEATCSILIARQTRADAAWPGSILVGVDGSEAAALARGVAERLAEATGARVRRLVATGGKPLGEDSAIRAELDPRAPVTALVDASSGCDLLVVGSRGLHGFATLGSVAERVAHEAHCPVLIVRGARTRAVPYNVPRADQLGPDPEPLGARFEHLSQPASGHGD